jgi:hypothetical protein
MRSIAYFTFFAWSPWGNGSFSEEKLAEKNSKARDIVVITK